MVRRSPWQRLWRKRRRAVRRGPWQQQELGLPQTPALEQASLALLPLERRRMPSPAPPQHRHVPSAPWRHHRAPSA